MDNRGRGVAVVTGVGMVCPIGIGATEFWESLAAGRDGIKPLPLLENTSMPVRFGGLIGNFEPKQYVQPRKSLKVMSHEIRLGFAAARLAMADAELNSDALDPDRVGVVYGSDMLYGEYPELEDVYRKALTGETFDYAAWCQAAMADITPLWLLKYLPNMAACHVGIAHNARGHNNTITLGDASSLIALIEAARVIERGHADVMIAGGTGSRLSLTPMLYRGDSNLSHRQESPASACRPFDADRDGIINGEGAGALILESRAHARARGARVLADVAGHGLGHEPRIEDRPESGSGVGNAIRIAMNEAGLESRAIDHVNARGLSTVDGDIAEARAIRRELGDVPVTAPKSYFGHLGAGSGAVELAVSVLALDRGLVPRTLNHQTADPRCGVNVIRDEPKTVTKPACIALNQAGTGQAAAVVLRRA